MQKRKSVKMPGPTDLRQKAKNGVEERLGREAEVSIVSSYLRTEYKMREIINILQGRLDEEASEHNQ
jgi:hypothetical protein